MGKKELEGGGGEKEVGKTFLSGRLIRTIYLRVRAGEKFV